MMILKIFISFWLWKILAFIFNVDTYFEGFRRKWFLATWQQKCCLLTIPVPLPQHTGRQFFSRFLAVRRVSQSDQQTRQNWSKPLLNLALETFCLSLLPPLSLLGWLWATFSSSTVTRWRRATWTYPSGTRVMNEVVLVPHGPAH